MQAADTKKAKGLRPLVTPDGVPLNLNLATFGERAGALMIDLAIMMGAFIALGLLAGGLGFVGLGNVVVIFLIIGFFLIRSFYFIFFEIKWHGSTPGKRAVGLRVIDRKGGRLSPDAIFARNLMREVEVWLPMTLFFVTPQVGLEKWIWVLNAIWLGIFVLLPVFNRDRLRAGDFIAGTMVIRAPRTKLLLDPVQKNKIAADEPIKATFTFTRQQLDVYGIFELQTLEQVLRTTGAEKQDIFDSVANQIADKIKWDGDYSLADAEVFLRDFYAAMRKHHEAALLFGKRKKDKFDTGETPRAKTQDTKK